MSTGTDDVLDRGHAARDCGVRLLHSSEFYERLVLGTGSPPEWGVVATFVARQRRHTRAVIALADESLFLEAQAILRVMFEFHVRLMWLLLNPPLHLLLWADDDIRSRLALHDDTWRTAGITIIEPATLANFKQQRAAVKARVAAIAANENLNPVPTYPNLFEQAKAIGLSEEYAVTYRFDSQSASHPSVLGLDLLQEPQPDGSVRILSEPTPAATLNVYGPAAIYLHGALNQGSKLSPVLSVDGLDAVLQRLREITPVSELRAQADR